VADIENPWPNSEPQGFGGAVQWMAYDCIVHPRAEDPPSSAGPIARPSFARPRANAQSLTATPRPSRVRPRRAAPIDTVLISHDHYDHLDDDMVRALVARHPDAAWAVPLGVAEFVRMRGASQVVELDW
jgi:L-ascorbate metabolism protein UlaG (beta-lactamase superfamily)